MDYEFYLQHENNQLKSIINDAVAYLATVIKEDRKNQPWKTDDQLDNLLDILRGDKTYPETVTHVCESLEERVSKLEEEIYHMKGND